MPLSPISTIPELYDDFDGLNSVDSHMRFMLQRIPHHQGHLTPTAQAAVYQGHSWEVIHPTPSLLPDSQSQPQVPQSFASIVAMIYIDVFLAVAIGNLHQLPGMK